MEITSTTQKGKSVVVENAQISYNIKKNGESDIQEISGVVKKDDKAIGFVSFDCVRGGFQFTLTSDNGISGSGKKELYDAFVDDIEELTNDSEEI